MAREVQTFSATILAGTPILTPSVTQMVFPPRIVERIEVKVPDGPNGLMGFAIRQGGQQVIPYGAGQWIVANDETLNWTLEGQIQSGSWALIGYNNGVFPHTLQVRFFVNLPEPPAAHFQPITADVLSGSI